MDRELMQSLSTILSTFLFLIILAWAFWYGARVQKRAFKDLIERFEVTTKIPDSALRPLEFRFGHLTIRNHVGKIVEEGEKFLLKIPFLPTLQIPYSAFSEFKIAKDTFKRDMIFLKFKDEKLLPVSFVLKDEELKQLPRLNDKLSTGFKSTSP